MRTAQQEAAERALKERDQLWRSYRRLKRAHLKRLYETPVYGAQLRAFARTLEGYGSGDAAAMTAYVRHAQHDWLRNAEPEIRWAALSLIGDAVVRIRTGRGLPPFDDPIPALVAGEVGERDDVFRICKRELGL